jgi:transcriptional regulator of acetoin/glycerol metabolism
VALAKGDVVGEDVLLLLDESTPAGRLPVASPSKTDRLLRDAVDRHIARVLEDVGGNKRRAARELGVSRATLDRRLRGTQR